MLLLNVVLLLKNCLTERLNQMSIIFLILFAKPLLFRLSRTIFACSVTHLSRGIILLVQWHFLEHDLNTWTDHAVETRDHVNLTGLFFRFFLYGICFWISVLKYVRLPAICTEIKFTTLMNRSPLNWPEVSAKIICLCARRQENRKFFAAKSKSIVYGKTFCCLLCVFRSNLHKRVEFDIPNLVYTHVYAGVIV